MNEITNMHRIRQGNIRILLAPAIVLSIGLVFLVADAVRTRNNQDDQFALPDDRSPASLLEFIREMDGTAEQADNFLESSNFTEVAQAVVAACKVIDESPGQLTEQQRREVDYFQIIYSGYLIFDGSAKDPPELPDLVERATGFIEQTTKFSTREQTISDSILRILEGRGRYQLAAKFASRVNEFFKKDDSLAAQSYREQLEQLQTRLRLPGQPMHLTTKKLSGEPFDLAELRGKVVLIEFYGTRCKPCIADFPALRRIYADNQDSGFEIVGICLGAPAARIRKFTEEHKLPWLQLCGDVSASLDCNKQLADDFGIGAVPTTILIDREGVVRKLGVRPLLSNSEQDLETQLDKLL